ncbi:MAG: cache domain-containing protein [Deltaproteobacteria bacterium]|nr:cache domain-containing protein [Candidatus Zymogenaceae bacterium]
MKKTLVIVAGILFLFSAASALPAAAEEAVTPAEVIAKVTEAADFLSEKGEAGLAQFNDPTGPWSWKDTYVFVFDCGTGIIIGHPNKDLVGTELASRTDKNGLKFNVALCKEAEKPAGGWVEYWRPTDVIDETGTTEYRRKVSYMLAVPGQQMEVGAGIYEPTLTVDELNTMLQK